jgi:hypothetical protein
MLTKEDLNHKQMAAARDVLVALPRLPSSGQQPPHSRSFQKIKIYRIELQRSALPVKSLFRPDFSVDSEGSIMVSTIP